MKCCECLKEIAPNEKKFTTLLQDDSPFALCDNCMKTLLNVIKYNIPQSINKIPKGAL